MKPYPIQFKTAKLTELKNGQFAVLIKFPFKNETLTQVKSIPGRIYFEKYWTCPLKIENLETLKKFGFQIHSDLQKFIEKEKYKKIDIVIPGLKKQLRLFQKYTPIFLDERDGCGIIGDDMGLGKTVQVLAWLQLHKNLKPVLIVIPGNLKLNWLHEIHEWIEETNIQTLYGEKPYPLTGNIVIINYEILKYWEKELIKFDPEVLICDECFPKGTKISTPKGLKNIEDLKIGDSVYNAVGIGTIQNINNRPVKKLVRLYLSNGKFIDTTENHPFFTNDGWMAAKNCLNKILFSSEDIFNIFALNINSKNNEKSAFRKTVRMVWKNLFPNLSTNLHQSAILFKILLSEMAYEPTRNLEKSTQSRSFKKTWYWSKIILFKKPTKSNRCIKSDENEQSYKKFRSPRKNKNLLERIWTSLKSKQIKGWKWKTSTLSPKNFMGCVGIKLGNRISNKNKTTQRFRLSDLLQSRHCFKKSQNLDRNRWLVSHFKRKERSRLQKRKISNYIRVERVEIYESASRFQSEHCVVYNLQVSGHPSYYAGGYLVHNCHFLKTNTAQRTRALMRIASHVPHRILLSGTLEENRNKEIFNAWKIVDPLNCPPYKIFLAKYCGGERMKNNGSTNLEELHFHLKKIMIRRLKEDVLEELPKRSIIVLPFEITDRKNYNLAWSNFIEYVQKIKAENKENTENSNWGFARLEELKQLAIKGILPQVIDWIDNFVYTGKKLVVFVTHKFTLDAIYNAFPEISVKMAGDTPTKDRKKIVDDFQTNPNIKLFIGMIDKESKPAGVGITLTAAYATLTVEQHWNPSPHDQADARVHRIGQTNKVFNYYAIAVNTIMEYIAKMHDRKRTITNKVLDNKEYENIFTELINQYK